MAIPQVDSVATTTMLVAGTSLDAVVPSGSNGDYLIAVWWAGGTFTPPSGWDHVVTQGENTFGSGEIRAYARVADGSEGATEEFTWTDTKFGNVAIARLSDVDVDDPINATNSTAGPNSDTQTSPSVTTDVPNCLILRALATDRIALAPFTHPSGHTEIWDFNGAVSFDASAGTAAVIEQPSAGASGTAVFVMSASRPVPLITIAIAGAEDEEPGVQGTYVASGNELRRLIRMRYIRLYLK
jgi:hypothetical protein